MKGAASTRGQVQCSPSPGVGLLGGGRSNRGAWILGREQENSTDVGEANTTLGEETAALGLRRPSPSRARVAQRARHLGGTRKAAGTRSPPLVWQGPPRPNATCLGAHAQRRERGCRASTGSPTESSERRHLLSSGEGRKRTASIAAASQRCRSLFRSESFCVSLRALKATSRSSYRRT